MKLEKIRIGRIVGVHGIRGELKIQPRNQDAAFLERFQTFYLDDKVLIPSGFRTHKGMAMLKFSGIENREAAMALRDKDLYILRDDAELPEDEYFDDELLGLDVYNGETGECIGELVRVEDYPASKVYTVEGVKEYLIPAVKEAFILGIDMEANRMDVRIWEGM
ncbi:MAG: 16S rRNA processing protein RimM [Oscillibacter sp.]|nr:16S rRNA processing protein RimM [Oscillibacter sp.]